MIGSSLEVCLVGVGPRGLSVLERLSAHERKSPQWSHITVHVVDPDPPGAGRVWRAAQSRHLLMNTVASQVTVYTDASVSITGPLEEGPSLYQWAKCLTHSTLPSDAAAAYDEETLAEARALGPDTYPTRVFYGHYLSWAFRQVTTHAAEHIEVRVHRSRAVALDDAGPDHAGPGDGGPEGAQTVLLEDGTRLTALSAVVLAQGHVDALPTGTESELTHFAAQHHLTYLPPANPADVDLGSVAPGETVLLRGLGLNFFDYMALLTLGRGGSFDRMAGGRLIYRPSGREPKMYAGSRRGVPYQARGENEKGADGRYLPRLLTVERIAALRERAAGGEPVRFRADLWPLIAKEVQGVYYAALLTARGAPLGSTSGSTVDGSAVAEFTARYLAAAPGPAEERLLDSLGIPEDQRWDWEMIARPYGTRAFASLADFRSWLREYLARDVREARAGNVSGPVKAAFDVLRDLRNEIRLAVDHGGLDGTSHRDELERWYTPLNAFLSIGPPVSRIEEMDALIEAGVLDVTGPGMRVRAEAGDAEGACFVGTSAQVPGLRVRATALIEARLPEVGLRRTADPLMRHLLGTGQCRPYVVRGVNGADYETGGLAVSERPYHLLNAQGAAHPRRFAYGVPTESVHWVTAAGIRPGVGSVTLEDSDALAGAVLALPPLPAAVASHGHLPGHGHGHEHATSTAGGAA
ncbi:FAD/NAD(P)-binding protein [Streptomyces sp. N2-109]|uniref:FAD/NAD(P)-binding protein n=1 Tax=Streptomyces gossypii TaxID=2883101 RepID=A0ABT2JPR6_9ACTN|nr:FAD/NAD(P)-binding protein [Streptomyces gossypii]MCT2589519.1 FAD/NAD(P)-binding protein [Streptomyces gossypii]